MKPRQICHRNGSYQVNFESVAQALERLPADARIVTDFNVGSIFGELLIDRSVYSVEVGERSKSIDVYSRLLSWLAETRASRKTILCAFGGGVVGDLAGFVAATYMRGIPYVQIPTSLLAQVDSSIGGKVGIDLPEGKNLAGAFYPPTRVSIPTDALAHLPERQFNNGKGEIWKYGFILDRDLVEILRTESLTRTSLRLPEVIDRCISLKAMVVESDEYETEGTRAVLNFGHTVGHALERISGYGSLLHGEAISVGMVAEARIGVLMGVTSHSACGRVRDLLEGDGLPIYHPLLSSPKTLVEAMYSDKKASGGRLAFSLITEIGQCRLVEDVEESIVMRGLEGE